MLKAGESALGCIRTLWTNFANFGHLKLFQDSKLKMVKEREGGQRGKEGGVGGGGGGIRGDKKGLPFQKVL